MSRSMHLLLEYIQLPKGLLNAEQAGSWNQKIKGDLAENGKLVNHLKRKQRRKKPLATNICHPFISTKKSIRFR